MHVERMIPHRKLRLEGDEVAGLETQLRAGLEDADSEVHQAGPAW